RWDADYHFGPAREPAWSAMGLADEMLDHLFGDLEVGDDAGPERPDRADVVGRLAHHQLGVVADRANLADAIFDFHRDHGRFAGDDALAADVDDRVGCAEVDRDVA